ncbi:MAG TPA: LamG domain-containing protein [Thermoanaerobaculia bacterium]|nr:LamG domain-containing protein [Thermoanaerobaculia bacterium]
MKFRERAPFPVSTRVLITTLALLAAGAAFGQPYNAWLTNSSGHGYIQLPATSALSFTGGSFTFEAWVSITDSFGVGCSSIAGNSYTQSTWIGICGTTLRSYLRGTGTFFDGGTVPANNWTHIAITYDAATRLHSHYIDGELVAQRTEPPGGITASTAAWRIFSDANWEHTPNGGIDEVRFWNVARTLAQIRSTITQTLGATPGLVAAYKFDANAADSIGSAHGTKVGTSANYINAAVTSGCTTSASTLCLGPAGRFSVVVSYKTTETAGTAAVVPFTTSDSGLFTFFSSTNWEAMVKVLNGCGINSRYWVFAAGMTDQHAEIEVTDLPRGVTKRYFNYSGVPFAPIQDVDALATCP